MPGPLPLILDDVELKIGTDSLKCLLSHIEVSPDITTVEIKTMCGSTDYPGTIKWLLRATLYMSYDVDGTFEILKAAVDAGVPVAFQVIPKGSTAVSATNPSIEGQVIPQPFDYINGDAGEASTIDIEWSIVGGPTVDTVGTMAAETPPEEAAA